MSLSMTVDARDGHALDKTTIGDAPTQQHGNDHTPTNSESQRHGHPPPLPPPPPPPIFSCWLSTSEGIVWSTQQ